LIFEAGNGALMIRWAALLQPLVSQHLATLPAAGPQAASVGAKSVILARPLSELARFVASSAFTRVVNWPEVRSVVVMSPFATSFWAGAAAAGAAGAWAAEPATGKRLRQRWAGVYQSGPRLENGISGNASIRVRRKRAAKPPDR
jgi:hypothetical protein